MAPDQSPKTWHPARCTHGGPGDEPIGPAVVRQHIVIILNNPLEDKDLLVDICTKGMHPIESKNSGGFMAHMKQKLVALYVLMVEQMNSIIYILQEKKKPSVFVLGEFATGHIVD